MFLLYVDPGRAFRPLPVCPRTKHAGRASNSNLSSIIRDSYDKIKKLLYDFFLLPQIPRDGFRDLIHDDGLGEVGVHAGI